MERLIGNQTRSLIEHQRSVLRLPIIKEGGDYLDAPPHGFYDDTLHIGRRKNMEESSESYNNSLPLERGPRILDIPERLSPGFLTSGPQAVAEYRALLKFHPLPQGKITDINRDSDLYRQILAAHYPDLNTRPDVRVTSYNPSSEFTTDPHRYRMKRIENLQGEDSVAVLHIWEKGKWVPVPEITFPIQDPFAAKIGGEIIMGGVATRKIRPDYTLYWTQFYKGHNVQGLEEWVTGPDGMKDIRMSEREDPLHPSLDPIVDIYTRPQKVHNEAAGPGKIGHTTMRRSEFLSMSKDNPLFAQRLAEAPMLPWNFHPDEWGGVNQSIYVTDEHSPYYGMNVLLTHQAFRDEDELRHYVARILIHDPVNNQMYDKGVVGEARDFPDSLAKRPDLDRIFFPTTLRLPKDTKRKFAVVEGGLRDSEHASKLIYNPLAA